MQITECTSNIGSIEATARFREVLLLLKMREELKLYVVDSLNIINLGGFKILRHTTNYLPEYVSRKIINACIL